MSYHITVLSSDSSRFVRKVSQDYAQSMVLRGQAEWEGKRVLRLRSEGIPHPCKTRISFGDLWASIGQSQKYTRTPINKPTNFKLIHHSDRGPFAAAWTGYEYEPLPAIDRK